MSSAKRKPVLVGDRLVELGDGARDLGEIDHRQRVAARAGLGLGDAEQRVEGAEQAIGLGDRLAQRLGIALRVGLLEQRHFEPRAQPRQRRAQIVRDIVGDLAHARHQPLDLVEHGVEVCRELVELVAAAGDRHALRQIAVDDAASLVRFTASTRRSMLRVMSSAADRCRAPGSAAPPRPACW